jgi:hypothetical protein
MVGYRRPKNLREMLVKANVPFREGDEKALPEGMKCKIKVEQQEPLPPIPEHSTPSVQRKILDFFLPLDKQIATCIKETRKEPIAQQAAGVSYPQKVGGTPLNKRGFNFCNTRNCRYCPNLDKSGIITSSVTKKQYRAMKNVSCRSSNLIYCVTCKRCDKQYVGQTYLRLKSRFVHHYYSVDKADSTKPVGKHFSQMDHRGTDDMRLRIHQKPPSSAVAAEVRNKVEKRWIHLLRSPAPQGLNID